MAQNVEPLARPSATPEIVDPDPAAPEDYEVGLKSLNQWQLAWRKFRKHRLALIGLGMIAFLIGVAVIGPVLLPFSFTDIPKPDQIVGAGAAPPVPLPAPDGRDRRPPARRAHARRQRRPDVAADRVLEHGDRRGHRDVRRAPSPGFAGRHRRQPADAHRRRHAQPADPVRDPRRRRSSSATARCPMVIVIFGLFSWMGVSRLVRSLFLSIREREFVEAAHAVGVRDRRIIFRHILPNAFSPIVVVGVAARGRQHHRGGVRELPRVRRRPDRRPPGATSSRAACSSSPRATGGGRCSRASRSSSRSSPSTSSVTACATRSIRGPAHDRDVDRPPRPRGTARRRHPARRPQPADLTSRSWTASCRPWTA